MMEVFTVLAIVVVLGMFANKYMKERDRAHTSESIDVNADLYDRAKKELETESNMNKETNKEVKIGTRDLFLETLTKIGCQYEIEEGEDIEEGDIRFGYQGEYFVVRASNRTHYIQIYDTHWGHVELYDIDEFARLKKAINESNIKNSVTTVYTIDEAGSNVDVHCKSVILFVPEIPNIADYLRLEFGEYFRVHETINIEMAKQRELEVGK